MNALADVVAEHGGNWERSQMAELAGKFAGIVMVTVPDTHAELQHYLRQYQKALGKPVITVHDRVVDGDKVWSRTTMRGANLQTGEPRTIDFLQIHRVVDGRIVEVWTMHATDVHWHDLP